MNSNPSKDKFTQFIEKIRIVLNQRSLEGFTDLFSSFSEFERYYFSRDNRNKQKGIYLTQNPITEFLIKRIIIRYLKEYFLGNDSFPPNLENFEDITTLDFDVKHVICERLLALRVIDPACGTGVFLLDYIKILHQLIQTTYNETDLPEKILKVIKNLYGFDINESAILLSVLNCLKWFNSLNYDLKEYLISFKSNFRVVNSINDDAITTKFDLIIGNPPYGNILSAEYKQILKQNNIISSDIYCIFLLKALEWSKGLIAFVTPKSFLIRQSYIRFRDLLLTKANLIEVVDIGPNIFPLATNEVQILIFEPKNNRIKNLEVFKFPRTRIITYKNQVYDTLKICYNKFCKYNQKAKKVYAYTTEDRCPFCKKATFSMNRIRIKSNLRKLALIEKIESQGNLNYLNIVDFPHLIRGEEDKGLKAVRAQLNKSGGDCYFLNAKKHFSYYFYNKKKSFDLNSITPEKLKGSNYEYYTKPKLLIKHNSIIPEAAYSEEKVCFTSSIYSLIEKTPIELKFLCSIINSSVTQFYCVYGINNQMNTTINLNQYMIRHLPIVEIERSGKRELAKEVDLISTALRKASGIVNQPVKRSYKAMEDIIFEYFNITNEEKKEIIEDLQNRINFTKEIYRESN